MFISHPTLHIVIAFRFFFPRVDETMKCALKKGKINSHSTVESSVEDGSRQTTEKIFIMIGWEGKKSRICVSDSISDLGWESARFLHIHKRASFKRNFSVIINVVCGIICCLNSTYTNETAAENIEWVVGVGRHDRGSAGRFMTTTRALTCDIWWLRGFSSEKGADR